MMASHDNKFGYEMEIITYPGSGIEKVEDIKGKKLAFTSETSNSGHKAPSALLRQQFKLEAGRDFEPVFSGKHDNSVLGVANKDYPAASIANSVMYRMIARHVINANQVKTIYKSQTFPTTGYGHVYNLKPELAAKAKEALFSFPWEGSALENSKIPSRRRRNSFRSRSRSIGRSSARSIRRSACPMPANDATTA